MTIQFMKWITTDNICFLKIFSRYRVLAITIKKHQDYFVHSFSDIGSFHFLGCMRKPVRFLFSNEELLEY